MIPCTMYFDTLTRRIARATRPTRSTDVQRERIDRGRREKQDALKELVGIALHSCRLVLAFRAKFQISTCPNLNRRLSLDGSPCVISRFMTRRMSLTHALTQLASTTIRSSSSVPPGRQTRTRTGVDANEGVARAVSSDRRSSRFRPPVSKSLTHAFVPNRIRIESAVSNAARTKLHWSRRYEGRDPIRRKKIRSDPMATRGSRERKPPAKVRRVDRSRANEKEKGCIERTLRSSVVSCRSRLKTMDLD